MKMTIRLVPLLAAAGFAAAACQQESVDTTNNQFSASGANAANSAGGADGANAAAPAASGQRAGASAPTIPAAADGVPTGGVCGGIAGAQCASAGDYCRTQTGQCQVADAQGTCATKPEICTQQYDPVCGCDGKTYGNACQAAAAGVNVDSRGECGKP